MLAALAQGLPVSLENELRVCRRLVSLLTELQDAYVTPSLWRIDPHIFTFTCTQPYYLLIVCCITHTSSIIRPFIHDCFYSPSLQTNYSAGMGQHCGMTRNSLLSWRKHWR